MLAGAREQRLLNGQYAGQPHITGNTLSILPAIGKGTQYTMIACCAL